MRHHANQRASWPIPSPNENREPKSAHLAKTLWRCRIHLPKSFTAPTVLARHGAGKSMALLYADHRACQVYFRKCQTPHAFGDYPQVGHVISTSGLCEEKSRFRAQRFLTHLHRTACVAVPVSFEMTDVGNHPHA